MHALHICVAPENKANRIADKKFLTGVEKGEISSVFLLPSLMRMVPNQETINWYSLVSIDIKLTDSPLQD